MTVSVIMPVYNRQDVLQRSVDSVLSQGGVDFELILVDDASTEPAEDLYRYIESRGHRVLRQAENQGPGAARNAGAEQARGEWLAFLDSDDHWLPGKLSEQLKSLRECGLVVGQTDEIWYRNGERVNPPKAHRISGGDLFRRSLRAVCVSSSTVMLKADLFRRMGGFDENLFVCEDYAFWLRVSAREKFDFCPQALVVKYGGHADQLSRALPAMDRFRILGILKGLQAGEWSSAGENQKSQEELALGELERKLRILAKGSAKRGFEEAVALCREITELANSRDYFQATQSAQNLVSRWQTRP